ncbi:MAG: Flp pilus assembly protein CpaB, partial [Pseudomonadota bacterium]
GASGRRSQAQPCAGGAEQRVVLRSIEPNEPILKNKITGYGEDATMAGQLTPGMRAYTLRIDTVSGVAGFLLPNDRVDIFLTRGGGNNLTANLIMQNVRVIAIDQFSDQEANQARVARTATVEVTPEDAQRLALAQQVGRISLSLRQIDDAAPMTGEDEKAPVISLGDIIPQEEVEQAAPARQVCVRKGVNVVCSPAGAAPAPAPAAAPETPATPTE